MAGDGVGGGVELEVRGRVGGLGGLGVELGHGGPLEGGKIVRAGYTVAMVNSNRSNDC